MTIEHVMDQVTRGNAECPGCGRRSDLREAVRHFNVFGQLESLFGLDVWTGTLDIGASTMARVELFDMRQHVPYEGEIAYANITPWSTETQLKWDARPWLLAPQESHHPWPMYMRFFIPPGPARHISLCIVVKPNTPLPLPRELALQAVGNFHRNHFNVASVLLAASVEASLRSCIADAYGSRGVKLPGNLGFGGLIERARMLLSPPFGPKLLENLNNLARLGRNPAAHGADKVSLSRDEVAMWMVDVATVYEWSRHAKAA